jgi:hypothetical protein
MEIFGISIGIDRSSDENALADLTIDERERYLGWWRKFKELARLNWLGIGLAVASPFGSQYYPALQWRYMFLLGLVLFVSTRIWLRVLTCPRCGATYSGGLITVIQRFSSLNTCYGCDLTKRALRALETRGY